MSIIVYWLEAPDPTAFFQNLRVPYCREFNGDELSAALNFCQQKRSEGCSHVCLSSENPNSVGKPGVDSVQDGKTPDGEDYTWRKRRS